MPDTPVNVFEPGPYQAIGPDLCVVATAAGPERARQLAHVAGVPSPVIVRREKSAPGSGAAVSAAETDLRVPRP